MARAPVTGGALAAPAAAPRPTSKFGVAVTTMLAMVAMIMSSTMVNVAIPDIMGAFGIGQDRAHWISTGFLAAMTAGMLLNAWLVTSFGPRNVFIAALALFSASAFAGQYAPAFEGVVAARFAQGLCAGLIQPLAMTTIFIAYPPEERAAAMGWFGMGIVFGPTIGPVLGGVIVDAAHWRFVFAAPVPMLALAAGLGAIYMPGREDGAARAPFNPPSFLLVMAAVMLLLSGISAGQRDGWNDDGVFLQLFGAAAAFLAFLVREARTEAPLLQIRLFAGWTYAASAFVGFVFGAGMFGSFYIVPVMVQTVHGFTALKAGLMLLPGGIVSMVAFPLAGRLADAVAPAHAIAAGLLLFGVSCLLLAGAGMLTDFWTLALLVALGRAGLALVVPPLNVTALAAAPRDLLPHAAGTLNFVRMTGAALGVTVLALTLDAGFERHGRELATSQTWGNPVSRELLAEASAALARTGLPDLERAGAAMAWLQGGVTLKAHELAFQDGFLALAALFAAGAAAALALLRWR